ncbi:acyl carrier protein [Micromonospora maritima]|uniref:acyl carrier protein n=1 Tax=Micromonospora maritima TaxID=986711 RepID=UPI0037B2DFDC
MKAIDLDSLIEILIEHGERDEDMDDELTAEQRDVPLADLGFDSLGVFNATVRISEQYGVEIPYDDVVQAKTLDDIVTVVNKTLATQGN